jgi:hypothetical protein
LYENISPFLYERLFGSYACIFLNRRSRKVFLLSPRGKYQESQAMKRYNQQVFALLSDVKVIDQTILIDKETKRKQYLGKLDHEDELVHHTTKNSNFYLDGFPIHPVA